MRLRLTPMLWATLPAAALAGEAATRIDVYDDERLRSWMPAVSARGAMGDWSGGVGWTADMVSGATTTLVADTVSSATTFSDRRQAMNADLSWTPRSNRELGAFVLGSTERDHEVRGAGGRVSLGLLDDLGQLSATATLVRDHDLTEGLDQRSTGALGDLAWQQVLGPRTLVVVMLSGQWWECGELLGCQASGYRWVLVDETALRERHPTQRGRAAAGLKLSQVLGERAALHLWGRVYADTWDLRGVSLRVAPSLALADERLILRAEARASAQNGVDWGEPAGELPLWRTGDRDLGPMRSGALGLRVEAPIPTPRAAWTLEARAERLVFDYATAIDSHGWLVGAGFRAEY